MQVVNGLDALIRQRLLQSIVLSAFASNIEPRPFLLPDLFGVSLMFFLVFLMQVVNGLLMATEVISLAEFHNHAKAGEFYDRYWVKCAIVRVVRNSTGNLMYPACASCFKGNSTAVKALDFSQTTSAQCCSAPVPSHRWRFQIALMDKSTSKVPINRLPLFTVWQAADHLFGNLLTEVVSLSSGEQHELVCSRFFDRMWLLEIGLSRKNRERTVWTTSKPDDTHLYIDNPSIEGLRHQFAEIGTDDASSAAAEHTALIDAISELGRLSLAVDDLASAADTLLCDVQQLRDDSRDIRSAIDTVVENLTTLDGLIQ
ncbi:hypothetical protein R1flu_023978 [Riccia fluitans]|uniref:Uncharacterized protein n=1 Tax=Riccia fluitans TaxID=41844 RepID=A0ABD1XWH4_9MARC